MVEGWMPLSECPPGVFETQSCGLGFKTEYKATETVGPTDIPGDLIRWKVGIYTDAYCLDSGEYFWGGAVNKADRENIMVRPVGVQSYRLAQEPKA